MAPTTTYKKMPKNRDLMDQADMKSRLGESESRCDVIELLFKLRKLSTMNVEHDRVRLNRALIRAQGTADASDHHTVDGTTDINIMELMKSIYLGTRDAAYFQGLKFLFD